MAREDCKATTASGERCRRWALDNGFCSAHGGAARGPEITAEERELFLAYIREHKPAGNKEAALAAGRHRAEFKALLASDPEFASDYREARGYGDEVIREEIRRRALEGVEEDVYGNLGNGQGTGVVGKRVVYSDRLIELLAKTLPEHADVRRLELTGKDGGPVEIEQHEVSADAVINVLIAVGFLDRPAEADDQPVPALAGAGELLPAHSEPEADRLPADRRP